MVYRLAFSIGVVAGVRDRHAVPPDAAIGVAL